MPCTNAADGLESLAVSPASLQQEAKESMMETEEWSVPESRRAGTES